MNAVRQIKQVTVYGAILVALLLMTACDQSGPALQELNQRIAETRTLFDFLPDQNFVSLGYTNVANMVNNPWARKLFEMYPALRVWDSKLGVSIDRFDSFAIAVSDFESRDPDILIIMKSSLKEDEILNLIGDRKRFFDEEKIGKRVQYISGEDFSFGVINDSIVALGAPVLVKEALRVANGEKKGITQSKRLKRFEPYFSKQDDTWLAVQNVNAYLNLDSGGSFIPRGFNTIDFVYFGLQARDGIIAQFIGEAENASNAGKLARSLGMIKGITKSLSQGILQFREEADYSGISAEELKQMFDAFIDNVGITSDEKQVIIRFVFPDELLDFFLELSQEALKEEQLKGEITDGIDSF